MAKAELAKGLACEKVAADMALAVQKGREAAAGGDSFGSAARHKQWPAVWLCRKHEEIGSNDLAGQRIFHNGSARKAQYEKAWRNTAQTVP